MQKRTKPVKKNVPFSRKPPKQVTLMIESKMLQETLIKSDGRSSTKANIKHLQSSTDRISQKVTLSLKDLNLSHKIPSSSLRPSTSRERLDVGAMTQRTSRSRHQEQHFPFRPFIGQKSRSLSSHRKLSGSNSCRHLKCSNEQHETPTPILNPLSHFKCFQRLLYRVTSYFESQKVCWEFCRLGYGNILRLLHRLEYIQHPTQEDMVQANHIQTLKKAYHFWLYISTESTCATLCNFLIMITAIEKIHIEAKEVSKAVTMFINYLCRRSTSFQLDSTQQPQYRFIVRKPGCSLNGQGELQFDHGQLLKIPHQFRLFILNRLNSHNSIQRQSQQQLQANPTLSERSQRLADIKRRKMVEIIKNRKPHVSTVSLHDILNFKAQQNSMFGSQLVSILNPLQKHQRISSQQLNFLSRPKRVVERDPIDLEYQRNEHECTFQPQIHEIKRLNSESNIVKNANKSIERMKEGRLFKKQKNKLIQSGWTNCYRKMSLRGTNMGNKQNKIASRRASTGNPTKCDTLSTIQSRQISRQPPKQIPYDQSTHQITEDEIVPASQQTDSMTTLKTDRTEEKELRIPLLFIDINIDEAKKERIVIYEQDSSEKLAEEFARRHNLDSEMQAKLRQLLEYQMSSILTKIQQQVEEQDNF